MLKHQHVCKVGSSYPVHRLYVLSVCCSFSRHCDSQVPSTTPWESHVGLLYIRITVRDLPGQQQPVNNILVEVSV